MPYDRTQWKITIGGTQGSQGEIWQTGLHMAPNGTAGDAPAVTQGMADDVAARVADWWDALKANMSNEMTLKWVKVAKLDLNGAYVDDPKIHEYVTYLAGLNGAGKMPYQVATVASLRSGSAIGTANYGRMYIPGLTSGTELSQGRRSFAFTEMVANATSSLIDGLNEVGVAIQPLFRVRNMSLKGTSKLVTRVLVGDVPDTQRRRRNQLVEIYAPSDVG
jgi:hypothetical protein